MKEQDWQDLLGRGNDYFGQGNWLRAQSFYKLAFDLLSEDMQLSPDSSRILMAWMGTCHNLAAVHECLQEFDQALNYLQIPYQRCRHLIDNHHNECELLIGLKSLNLSWSALLLFAKNHPEFMKTQPLAQDLAHALNPSSIQLH